VPKAAKTDPRFVRCAGMLVDKKDHKKLLRQLKARYPKRVVDRELGSALKKVRAHRQSLAA